MAQSIDVSDVDDGDPSESELLSIVPGLPGETTVAFVSQAILSALPNGAKNFVRDNLSLRKADSTSEGTVSIDNAERPQGGIPMAGLSTLAAQGGRMIKSAANAAKSAPKPKLSRLEQAKATAGAAAGVGTTIWGVGEILDFAKENYPAAYDAVSSMFSSQGVDVESDAVRTGQGNTRNNVVAAFGRNGVDEVFVQTVGLNKAEQAEMMKIIAAREASQVAVHDKGQVGRISTGNPDLDSELGKRDIAEVAEYMGLVGPSRAKQLYKIAQVINSITEGQVEAFERHEKLFGRIKVRQSI